jgi:hypothetical protein
MLITVHGKVTASFLLAIMICKHSMSTSDTDVGVDWWVTDNNRQMNVACHCCSCWWTSWQCDKNCVLVLKQPSYSFWFQCMELLSNWLLVDVSIEGVSSWNPNLSCYQIGSSSIFHLYLVAMKTTWRICDPHIRVMHQTSFFLSSFVHL